MKKLRGIIIAGGMNYEAFSACLKDLQRPFETACMDLRSQVVREVCITIAYLSQQLKSKFASFGETVLPMLMNIIQNSAKVLLLINYYSFSSFVAITDLTLLQFHKSALKPSLIYIYIFFRRWLQLLVQLRCALYYRILIVAAMYQL